MLRGIDATLLNTQKQEVFQVLRSIDVDPFQFDWSDREMSGVPGRGPRYVSMLREQITNGGFEVKPGKPPFWPVTPC